MHTDTLITKLQRMETAAWFCSTSFGARFVETWSIMILVVVLQYTHLKSLGSVSLLVCMEPRMAANQESKLF